jgi:hypothetical protein
MASRSNLIEMAAARAETSTSWGRLLLFLGLIGIVTTACAQAAGTHGGGSSSSPLVQAGQSAGTSTAGPGGPSRTVTIGPGEAGKTITLRVGDTLIFSVPGASRSMARAWHILAYPKELISLTSRSSTPPFLFRARSTGIGELRLTFGPRCGGPGPLAAGDQACPVSDAAGGPPGFASRLITFPLKVLPRNR